MRSIIAGAAILAITGLAIPAKAVIFYSNYIPSQTSFVQTGGAYPVKRRAPDATQSFDTFATSREFQFGVVCCTFRSESVATQFIIPTSFTATSIVVPLKHISSVGNRNMALTVQQLQPNGTWANARNESWAIIPSLTTGVITEVEAHFGSNSTNLPQFFTPRPISFVAGETYRIITSNSAGGMGRVDWYLSDEAASAGQSLQRYSYKTAVSLAYQPAFALTDGGDLTFPVVVPPPPPFPETSVPEPGIWAMLISGFGLIGAIARRCRRLPRAQAVC